MGSHSGGRSHLEVNTTTGTINKVRMLNQQMLNKDGQGELPRKIFITGSPYGAGPDQMAGLVATLEDERWRTKPKADAYGRRRRQHRYLPCCTSQKLIELAKTHRELVKALQKGKLEPADRQLSNM